METRAEKTKKEKRKFGEKTRKIKGVFFFFFSSVLKKKKEKKKEKQEKK
jgi:hypothetical protein